MSETKLPEEGQIVFVAGGVAQYRGGAFYSGMEDPRYTRQIQWPVKWWYPITNDPAAELLEALDNIICHRCGERIGLKVPGHCRECDPARAAIARAEGKP